MIYIDLPDVPPHLFLGAVQALIDSNNPKPVDIVNLWDTFILEGDFYIASADPQTERMAAGQAE